MRIKNYESLIFLHYINELVCLMYVKGCHIVSFTEESSIWSNKNAYDYSPIVDRKSLNGYFGKQWRP